MTQSSQHSEAPTSIPDRKTDEELVEDLCRSFNMRNFIPLCLHELACINSTHVPEPDYRGAIAFLMATYLHWDEGMRVSVLKDLNLSPLRYLLYAKQHYRT